MLLRRCLAALGVGLFLAGSMLAACSGREEVADAGADARSDTFQREAGHDRDAARDSRHEAKADAGPDGDAFDGDGTTEADGGSAPFLTNLTVTSLGSSPLTLTPPFSPTVFDYSVRCATGSNAASVSIAASPGADSALVQPTATPPLPSQTVSIVVNENQAIVAVASKGAVQTEYWVRCLPSDFPVVQWDPHPEAGAPVPGYYLIGNFAGSGAGAYAFILDGNGVPVWYYRAASSGVSDVDAVVKGAVSFTSSGGGPYQIHQLSPYKVTSASPTGYPIDEHELQVTTSGNYLSVSVPVVTGVDLTGLPPIPRFGLDGGYEAGPNSNIRNCTIVEFDPATGKVAWSWQATDHFDPAKVSIEPIFAPPLADGGVVIDPFHCNSIDIDPANDNLLVSSRQMNSVFYIDKTTGTVLWKMGGATASKDGARYISVADPFVMQHDARLQPGWSTCTGGQVSLFDDETGKAGPSRAVLYDVSLGDDAGCDGGTAAATSVWQYKGVSTPIAAGSFRIQPDGSRVIGWGLQPNIVLTEVSAAGEDVLDIYSSATPPPLPVVSYRALKVPTSTFDITVLRQTAGHP